MSRIRFRSASHLNEALGRIRQVIEHGRFLQAPDPVRHLFSHYMKDYGANIYYCLLDSPPATIDELDCRNRLGWFGTFDLPTEGKWIQPNRGDDAYERRLGQVGLETLLVIRGAEPLEWQLRLYCLPLAANDTKQNILGGLGCDWKRIVGYVAG
jgi:hypothetical protein